MTKFEWDESKRLRTLRERGLDFRIADLVFDGRPILEFRSDRLNEVRTVTIADIDTKLIALVWTTRGDAKRVISVRRARNGEERAYREIYE